MTLMMSHPQIQYDVRFITPLFLIYKFKCINLIILILNLILTSYRKLHK